LRQRVSSWVAVTAWPSFCATLRPPGPARRLKVASGASSSPASCIVRVEAPRVRVFHRLPQAALETARQSTPLCS
jgi:hypothetical protein